MAELQDKTQKLYTKQNKDLDLQREVEPLAMWAFACALAPFVLSWIPVVGTIFFLAPFAAIILGIIALNRIKQQPKTKKGKGFAIASIAIGALMIFVGIIFIVIFFGILALSFAATA